MSQQTLPRNQIQILPRDRKDYGDIEDLAESIRTYGLLQPIGLDQNNTLIFGGRRLAAMDSLGWTDIPYVRKDNIDDMLLAEMETEENIRRKNYNWREELQAHVRIHQLRRRRAILAGEQWTPAQTGEVIGYSQSYVYHILDLVDDINTKPYESCESVTDAIKLQAQLRIDAANAELAKRTSLVPKSIFIQPSAQSGYHIEYKPLLPPLEQQVPCPVCNGFNSSACLHCCETGISWSDGRQICRGPVEVQDTPSDSVLDGLTADDTIVNVDLSNTLFLGDSIYSVLHKFPNACVDHIITDPPYAIDVAYMQQAAGGLVGIDRIAETHDVIENLSMFANMFPAFYRILKDTGFCCVWCDIMSWQTLYDYAITAGFKVQRWPVVWCKTHRCINQSAQYNVTKSTEFVMVCRKDKGLIPQPVANSYFLASNDDKLSNPFAKPFEAWKWLFDAFTIKGQTILDPFAGEGSSILAGLRTNHKMIAIEKDEKHFNEMLEQVKQYYSTIFKKVNFV